VIDPIRCGVAPWFDQAVRRLPASRMAHGAYDLKDIDWPMIRLYCPDCHRFAQFSRAGLVERFGADQCMPSLLRVLKPCSIGNSLSGPQCQLVFFDRLMPERQAEAVARGGLPATWQVDWHSPRL
jgi:hypothetical protein